MIDLSRDARHPAIDRGMGMIARRKFNHITAGLLSKFLTRYNDVDGYWALGVLYTEARAFGSRVEIDMLHGRAQPDCPACMSVARSWAVNLREALGRHGIAPDALAAVTISLEFGLAPLPKLPSYPYPHNYGPDFRATLRLQSRDGRVFVRQDRGYCTPHEEFWGTRSTRRAG
ncbi:hypothetical protein [Massilia alkalitolerans]|uniref:hypothetical protein n=1 Tax=Massilia alkalitolerans TaxID=286638 RepID=UPI0028B03FBC|nr:hypothetical protein [Massilia alkalitolerans]